jgi:pSer/pThr/pTyr-binding forkhead associated (FHA) protein
VDLSKLSVIFKIIIIGIVYIVIFIALRIMYKDIKGGGRKRNTRISFGLEIINITSNSNMSKGSVIPIHGEVTIGRKNNNMLVLDDVYVSGYHARVFIRNNEYVLEDLGSTNGTLLNDQSISGKVYLHSGDEIRIGSTIFKVIG